jgi:hypothetical protein
MNNKNNNQIPDKWEFVLTYTLVALFVYFAFQNPENAIIYLTPAAALSGLRDWEATKSPAKKSQ